MVRQSIVLLVVRKGVLAPHDLLINFILRKEVSDTWMTWSMLCEFFCLVLLHFMMEPVAYQSISSLEKDRRHVTISC